MAITATAHGNVSMSGTTELYQQFFVDPCPDQRVRNNSHDQRFPVGFLLILTQFL
jgi:hypothetical protein